MLTPLEFMSTGTEATRPEPEHETNQSFEEVNLHPAVDWEQCPPKFRQMFRIASLDKICPQEFREIFRELAFDQTCPPKFRKFFQIASLNEEQRGVVDFRLNITDDEKRIIVSFLNAHPHIKFIEISTVRISGKSYNRIVLKSTPVNNEATTPKLEYETKQSSEEVNLHPAFDWEQCPPKFRQIFRMASLDKICPQEFREIFQELGLDQTCPPKFSQLFVMASLNEKEKEKEKEKETLNLSNMNITADEVSVIVCFLNAHPHFKFLEIYKNTIGDAGAIALARVKLKSLNACFNNIGDKGACGLALSTTIEFLYLNFNPVGDLGVQALTANTKFRELCLGNIQLINQHDTAKSFLKNDTLRIVQLCSNDLDSISAMIISLNSSIRKLDLSDNEIDDMGALALSRMPNLEYLCLDDNNLGDEGATVLVKKEFLGLEIEDNEAITEKGAFALLQKEQDSVHENDVLWPARKSTFLKGTDPKFGVASRVRFLPAAIVTKILDFAAPRPFALSHSFPDHIECAFRARAQRISTRKTLREDEIGTPETEHRSKKLKPSKG